MENDQCKKAHGLVRRYVAELKKCVDSNETFQHKIEDEMICAEVVRTGACKGDSGGPFTVMEKGQHILLGVTSWSFGCAEVNVIKTISTCL